MYAVVPLWIAAGLADWFCHRATLIEHTSGLPENRMHWLLFAEGAVALLAAALLEVNAGVLVLVAAAFIAHELTTYLELRYTVQLRPVRPLEQMIHSFMELLPLLLLALLAVMAVPGFGLQWKQQPWPADYLAAAATGVLVFNGIPLAEETWRCLQRK